MNGLMIIGAAAIAPLAASAILIGRCIVRHRQSFYSLVKDLMRCSHLRSGARSVYPKRRDSDKP